MRDSTHDVPAGIHCAPPPADSPWDRIDRVAFATLAKLGGGLSPFGLRFAYLDWATHLACSPGKMLALWQSLISPRTPPLREGAAADRRFEHPGWAQWPYRELRDGFMHFQAFWDEATRDVAGVQKHHLDVMHFMARQCVDTLSPSNLWWTNPEVLEAGAESGGLNFVRGGYRMYSDLHDLLGGDAPGTSPQALSAYRVGRDIAVTPGQVVFRNDVFELIRYAPATAEVWSEPIVLVPSWLLKYYILDLSPHNSLVRHLVHNGYTVFAMSWRNPSAKARNLGLDDYLDRGLLQALAEAGRLTGSRLVHSAGYCLGGTLLAACAAALARTPKAPVQLKTMTLLAAQTDFTEPGELGLFLGASAGAFLDALMWQQGYLDGAQLAGVFQLLNARDLIWSRLVRDYLLGRSLRVTDMMAWNADRTRLPYRLHSETLRMLYRHNDLAEGRYCHQQTPLSLSDVQTPSFVVATERDHISPWKSVYKLHRFCSQELTFVLASGGHNVGIVAPPDQLHGAFRIDVRRPGQPYRPPEAWLENIQATNGSWWPAWTAWLDSHSRARIPAAELATQPTLGPAPGTYVMEH